MKILIVTDKQNSAIDILSQNIKKYNPHFDIFITSVHPKRPSKDQLQVYEKQAIRADTIHFQYWKTAELLRENYPEYISKASILTHHNPYDLKKENWLNHYSKVVVKNKYQHSILSYADIVPHCIDFEVFTFNQESEPIVGMVASRIESTKGIKEALKATIKAGYKFLLVGRVSKRDYFEELKRIGGDNFTYKLDVSDKELVDSYHSMRLLIANSKDDFESGSLPILEAMATGTPVITRNTGLVPDINNGKNMVVREGEQNDIEELEKEIKFLMESKQRRLQLQLEGFKTVARRPAQKAARMYSKLYYDLRSAFPLISIVIPTYNRAKSLLATIATAEAQTYSNTEIVIGDDTSTDNTYEVVMKARREFDTPIKYVKTDKKINLNTGTREPDTYGLAEARNKAVIESQGEYIVFLDDRLGLKPDAVAKLYKTINDQAGKRWVYGVKDGAEKGFVENFSIVNRQHLVVGGLFNEEMIYYGGMSQDIRERFGRLGFSFVRANKAHAYSLRKSSRWFDKKEEFVKSKYLLFKLYSGV